MAAEDRYDSRGRVLDGPDDIRSAWRCDCGAEEHTWGDLPKGWGMVQTGTDGCEYAYLCERCRARL